MFDKKTIGVIIASVGAGLCTAIATWLQAKQAADQCYEDFGDELKLKTVEGIVEDLTKEDEDH